jgi:hypothetical protein
VVVVFKGSGWERDNVPPESYEGEVKDLSPKRSGIT